MMREASAATLAKEETRPPILLIPSKHPSEAFDRGALDNASPSPMTLFSTLLAENEPFADSKLEKADSKPFSSSLAGILPSPNLFNSGGELSFFNSESATDMLACTMNSTREGSANVQELSVSAKYKSMMPSKLPIPATSGYLTIPPGLSPTTLLESPVFFNAEMVDVSPTTGSLVHSASKIEFTLSSAVMDVVKQKDICFKQQGCFGSSHRPVDAAMEPQLVSGLPGDTSQPASMLTFEPTSGQALGFLHNGLNLQSSSESAARITRSLEVTPNVQISTIAPQCIRERTTVDGYNWKKYGQKQLKGTEFPRSYYKCTHPNCSVKKQVESSHEGEITEIMYKGEHNHAKPQGLRRGARTGGYQSFVHENTVEASNVVCKAESDRFSTDLSSSSLVGGLAGTPEQSFCSPSTEEGEDVEQGKAEDDGEDEQDSKRRKIGNFRETLSSAPLRTIREPRVVVQTTSEVDILDDGYRWRKYGQKVVKGNRFPRSYYKCTNIGCIVRKHVERSSSDPTSVMTAYEGKHNHNVPAARGSVRETGGATAGPPPFAPFGAMGLSSLQRPTMLYETQELGSIVDNSFNGGNHIDASMANPYVPNVDKNGGDELASSKISGRGTGLDLSVMRRFGVGAIRGQDMGSNFLQPLYPSSSSSCVAEGHLSRS